MESKLNTQAAVQNDDVYEDQTVGTELSKHDINVMAWRSLLLQASFNYERMQAAGWLYGLAPSLKKFIPIKTILVNP